MPAAGRRQGQQVELRLQGQGRAMAWKGPQGRLQGRKAAFATSSWCLGLENKDSIPGVAAERVLSGWQGFSSKGQKGDIERKL